eukprot:6189066-Pleurochrysis_carterae.AAC.3
MYGGRDGGMTLPTLPTLRGQVVYDVDVKKPIRSEGVDNPEMSASGGSGLHWALRHSSRRSTRLEIRSSTKRYDGSEYRLQSARKWYAYCVILATNGVRSGIRGSDEKSDGKSARRAVQIPKCVRMRPSPLLSACPSPTELERMGRDARERDFCPVSRPRLKVRAGHLTPNPHRRTALPYRARQKAKSLKTASISDNTSCACS